MAIVTWDAVNKDETVILSNGNLTVSTSTNKSTVRATQKRASGKWYWEVKLDTAGGTMIGVANELAPLSTSSYSTANVRFYYYNGTTYTQGGAGKAYGSSFTTGDVVGVALDLDSGTLTFYKNNVSQGVAFDNIKTMGEVFPAVTSGATTASKSTVNFGATPFQYPVPSGYKPYQPLNKTLIQLENGEYVNIIPAIEGNVIPKMTSNTAPSGVASASGTRSPYEPYFAFNGIVDAYGWHVTENAKSGWLSYGFTIPKTIVKYRIANWVGNPASAPKDWTFEGSNGGSVWDILDTRSGITGWNDNIWKVFEFQNVVEYKYYRINIISNNGFTSLAVSELEMFESPSPPSWQTVSIFTPPTKADFETHGIDDLSTISSELWSDLYQLSPKPKFITFVPGGNAPSEFEPISMTKALNMTALPHGQIAVQKEAFVSKGGVEKVILETISVNGKPQGIIKVAFSEDNGTNWRVFKNGGWNRIPNVDKSELKQSGMTLDEVILIPPNSLLSLTGSSEKISIAYYIEEDIRERDSSIVESVTLSQDTVLGTPHIKDMAMSILNTKSTINLQLLGTNLIGTVDDVDKTKVRYRAFLNGVPYHPKNGEFTQLMPSPANISLNIYSRDIKLGEENILRVEFEDSWGATDFKEIPFIGDYVGLIFKDPKGEAYSTELGELLKYLDIGTLIAGQVSNEYEIQIHNSLGYDVINPMVKGYTEQKGIEIELSKTTNPFQSEGIVTWDEIMKSGDILSFYMRIATKYTTPPKMGADFSVRVYATKI